MDKFDEKVIGYESTKEILRQILDILKRPEVYKRKGISIPRGLLMESDPGLGKSLLASILMEESERKPFVFRKTSQENSFLDELRAVFAMAKEDAPSILLLEDLNLYVESNSPYAPEWACLQACIDDTLQKVREVVNDSYSYSSDYEVIGKLKQFADRDGVCVLIVHHTRKQPAGDSFEMISGTTGLLGCADGALLMQKEKRTNSKATLEVVGRDQPDQRLYLSKDQESLVWVLDHAENELWKQPPDPVLEAVAKIVSADNREWEGSPTELAQAIQTDMAVNRLTKHLNVNASRLLEEHQVRYENKTKHAGRRIRLTYMMVEAPAFEVIE